MKLRLLPAALALLAAHPVAAREIPVALTFDDLPELSLIDDQTYDDETNRALIAGLRRHHFAATGFAVCGKLDDLVPARQTAILDEWLAAGFDLGNHTQSHDSPEELGTAGYIADIAKCDAALRPILARHGRTPRWFRHPYLETGAPLSARHAIDGWLARHRYRVAPVTIVPSDYVFSEPYDAAIAHHDEAHARALRRAWLAYFRRALTWYGEAARGLFGRDIAHVLLLHGNRLNADTIDDLAAILREKNFKVVPLDKAMKDPAYRTADAYAKKDGIDWIERWSLTLKKPLPWNDFREPPARIQAEYAKVDKDAETTPLTLDDTAPPAEDEAEKPR
ncbi:MAG: polysaccharide deacetylase family protein [Sphingomonadales bacterium]|nr:polysaccharide deacetylase family protein [Sphingomonadales bacterium]